jgi:hypothetical protein
MRHVRNQSEAGIKQCLLWLLLRPWRRHIPPKHLLTYNGPHGVISQKTTWNGTSDMSCDSYSRSKHKTNFGVLLSLSAAVNPKRKDSPRESIRKLICKP